MMKNSFGREQARTWDPSDAKPILSLYSTEATNEFDSDYLYFKEGLESSLLKVRKKGAKKMYFFQHSFVNISFLNFMGLTNPKEWLQIVKSLSELSLMK